MELTPEEEALAVRIGFDEDVLRLVKRFAVGSMEQMVDDDHQPIVGLVAALPTKLSKSESAALAEQCVALRRELRPQGYLAYRTVRNSDFYTAEERRAGKTHREPLVALLRTADPSDILRAENTSAGNYDLDNAGVIAVLREWDQKYGLEIVAADHDTVELRLQATPGDALTFARAVYRFCPDIIDQGSAISFDEDCGFGLEFLAKQGYDLSGMAADIDPTEGGIQILAQDIEKHRTVLLWWD